MDTVVHGVALGQLLGRIMWRQAGFYHYGTWNAPSPARRFNHPSTAERLASMSRMRPSVTTPPFGTGVARRAHRTWLKERARQADPTHCRAVSAVGGTRPTTFTSTGHSAFTTNYRTY